MELPAALLVVVVLVGLVVLAGLVLTLLAVRLFWLFDVMPARLPLVVLTSIVIEFALVMLTSAVLVLMPMPAARLDEAAGAAISAVN